MSVTIVGADPIGTALAELVLEEHHIGDSLVSGRLAVDGEHFPVGIGPA